MSGRLVKMRLKTGSAVRLASLLSILVLTACQTGGSGGVLSSVLSGNKNDDAQTTQPGTADGTQPQQQAAVQPGTNPNAKNRLKNTRSDLVDYCPAVRIRAGTETYREFPKGADKENDDELRHQATITKVARECAYVGQNLEIKVGARGRLITGPKGQAGDVKMPIRVAVTKGNETIYSKLHRPVEVIPSGSTSAAFSFVDDKVVVPAPTAANLRVYIGFDEGPYNTP